MVKDSIKRTVTIIKANRPKIQKKVLVFLGTAVGLAITEAITNALEKKSEEYDVIVIEQVGDEEPTVVLNTEEAK